MHVPLEIYIDYLNAAQDLIFNIIVKNVFFMNFISLEIIIAFVVLYKIFYFDHKILKGI